MEFLSGRVDGKFAPGADGTWTITLPELLGVGASNEFGGTYGGKENFMSAVKKNLDSNWFQSAGQIVMITAGNAVLKKMGLYRNMNKLIRGVGLGQLAKF
jgi:hypothetical protein